MRNTGRVLFMGYLFSFAILTKGLACPSGQIEDSSTGHCLRTSSDCDGKCNVYYDTTTHELRIEKKPEATGDIIVNNQYQDLFYFSDGSPLISNGGVVNMTIGEGITQIGANWNTVCPGCGGKLTLPQSLEYIGPQGFYNNSFDIIEINSTNLIANRAREFVQSGNKDQTFIIPASSDIKFSVDAFTFYNGGNINILCKGNKNTCVNLFKEIKEKREEKGYNLYVEYYTGLDKDGNWEVWSDNGKAVYADSSMQKLIAKYDFDGNQIGSYKYDAGGNLVEAIENGIEIYRRRIYTPAEATAAVSGKNTFSIKYR